MAQRATQPGILAPLPPYGCSLSFRLVPDVNPRPALGRSFDGAVEGACVVGIGEPLSRAVGMDVPGLRVFPALAGDGVSVPSTQEALWVFLRGAGRSEIFDAHVRLRAHLGDAFELADAVETFAYRGNRDLTGYEDGTENPKDAAGVEAAILAAGPLAGSSFVAVQRWEHDLRRFRSFVPAAQDATIGRARESNDELPDAPPSAHVKRSAQESFDPPAFMVRRSMPWASADAAGLEFVAYGESLDRYERVLRRMIGLDDGVVDALFGFSRPVTGGYYWCPPIQSGRLAF